MELFIRRLLSLWILSSALALPAAAQANDVELFKNWLALSSRDEAVRNLVQEALNSYQAGNYDEADKKLEEAANLSPSDQELKDLRESAARLARLRQDAQAIAQGQNPSPADKKDQKVDWTLDDLISLDRNRYLLAFWLDGAVNSAWYARSYTRAGLSLTGEGFLPYLDKRIGLSASFSFYGIDFAQARIAQDYFLYNYTAALVYRAAWRLPALEEQVTLALKLGIYGQFVTETAAGLYPDQTQKNYLLPYFEISFQDAVLSHIWNNAFTRNLTFTAALGVNYLPGDHESAGVDLSAGIYWRIGWFLVGPRYRFRFHRALRKNTEYRYSIWSLSMSAQF